MNQKKKKVWHNRWHKWGYKEFSGSTKSCLNSWEEFHGGTDINQTNRNPLCREGSSKHRNSILKATKALMTKIRWGIVSRVGFPWGLSGKESLAMQKKGSIPGSGRSPGGRHGNPLQYSCLENPMERGTWQAIVHRIAKSWTQLKQLAHTHSVQSDMWNAGR